ncbi:MAG: hypothetical protein WC551_12270 [Patescibacteria group bacterium]
MWTNVFHNLIAIYTGLVVSATNIQTDTNIMIGSVGDITSLWAGVAGRCLGTVYATNALPGSYTAQVVKIDWVDSSNTYAVYQGTNAPINKPYSYGAQVYTEIVNSSNNNGWFWPLDGNTAWVYNMNNYRVTPLFYTPGFSGEQLTNALPTHNPSHALGFQSGRYIHDYTQHGSASGTVSGVSNAGVYVETNYWLGYTNVVIDGITNRVVTNRMVISTNERAAVSYDPTNQRPNAITWHITLPQRDAVDAKLKNCMEYYANHTLCTAGMFKVAPTILSNVWVGQFWLDEVPGISSQAVITNTGSAESYLYYTIITNEISGDSTNYDRLQVVEISGDSTNYDRLQVVEIEGAIDDYTRSETHTVPATEEDYTECTTNTHITGGIYATSNAYDAAYTNIPEQAMPEGIPGDLPAVTNESIYYLAAVSNADFDLPTTNYYPGDQTNYDFTLPGSLTNTPGTASNFTFYTVSTSAPVLSDESEYNLITYDGADIYLLYIWSGVSNLLAEYLEPWIIDHTNFSQSGTTNTYSFYQYNLGWNPDYNTGWRLYEGYTNFNNAHPSTFTNERYWIETYTTNYFLTLTNTDYYKYYATNDYFRYQRYYDYWWSNTLTKTTNYTKTTIDYFKNSTNYYVNSNVYYKNNFTTNYFGDSGKTNIYITYTNYGNLPVWNMSGLVGSGIGDGTNLMQIPALGTNAAVYAGTNALPLFRDVIYERMALVTNLQWALAGSNFVQVEYRTKFAKAEGLSWPNGSDAYQIFRMLYNRWYEIWVPGSHPWSSVSTGTLATVYYSTCNAGGTSTSAVHVTKQEIRVRRKPFTHVFPQPAIDVYARFGDTLPGRARMDDLPYERNVWVKVDELCLDSGEDVSGWLGEGPGQTEILPIDTVFEHTGEDSPACSNFWLIHGPTFTIQQSSMSPLKVVLKWQFSP